jgi:putative transposase
MLTTINKSLLKKETVIQLRFGLKRYFEFYNHGRLHQSLDYQTPNEVHFSLEC